MDPKTVELELQRRKDGIIRAIRSAHIKSLSLSQIRQIADVLVREGYVDETSTYEVMHTLDKALDIACSPETSSGELTDEQKTERNLKREECIKLARQKAGGKQ